jgi:2,3-dihydroxyphenylpropionate 1,2-dioxygenase
MNIGSSGAARSPKVGVVGAAIVSHAPQFLSLPPTEDHEQISRVRVAMKQVGDGLRALDPDLVIVISNCHAEELIVHCVPAFLIHCGDRAPGTGKHSGDWLIDGEAGNQLLRSMLDEGFDPAFSLDLEVGTSFTIAYDFCGFSRDKPFLPLFVNAYVPPQPLPERCFAFGRALARSLERIGRRAVIIASGGLSHYPATPMYPTPDLETDKEIFAKIASGNLLHVMSFDETRLDKSGNIECRSLQILAGAIGDRKPDFATFEPSWHHIHAIVGYTKPSTSQPYVPYYPGFSVQHTQLARAIYALIDDANACARFVKDRRGYAKQYALGSDEVEALVTLDENLLRERYSINPLMTLQAKFKTGDRAGF